MNSEISTSSYPEVLGLDLDELKALGYKPYLVSIFDHILTRAECERNVMSYSEALSQNRLEDYLMGEARFLSMYRKLAEGGGAFIVDERPILFDKDVERLDKVILRSLREEFFMDIVFFNYEIRVAGSYDRTDVFLTKDSKLPAKLINLIEESGLYIIDK